MIFFSVHNKKYCALAPQSVNDALGGELKSRYAKYLMRFHRSHYKYVNLFNTTNKTFLL